MPSTIVFALPNFLVSSLIRIRCCSFSISPQTHKSFGSPHVEQTSAMTLQHSIVTAIYKSFKARTLIMLACRSKLAMVCHVRLLFVTGGCGCAAVRRCSFVFGKDYSLLHKEIMLLKIVLGCRKMVIRPFMVLRPCVITLPVGFPKSVSASIFAQSTGLLSPCQP